MRWQFHFAELASREMDILSRRNPEMAGAISRRINWLVQNADAIWHERLTGTEEFSLHVGQYRVLYLLEYDWRLITITDLGKHDEVYGRLRER